MADDLKAVSQIRPFAPGSTEIGLIDASDLAKVLVKAGPGTNLATQLQAVTIGHSVLRGQVRIGSVRPGEWLYLGPHDATAAAVADLDLAGHTAVTDVTHAKAVVRVSGRRSRDLLARCMALDTSDLMFPEGAMGTVPVAGVRSDVIRHDLDGWPSYLLVFDRSYGQYMSGVLADVATEF